MTFSRTSCLFIVAVAVLLQGCSLGRVIPRKSLTAAKARKVIEAYQIDRLKRSEARLGKQYDEFVKEIKATDEYFIQVEEIAWRSRIPKKNVIKKAVANPTDLEAAVCITTFLILPPGSGTRTYTVVLKKIHYSELGQIRLYYSGLNIVSVLTVGIIGPTMTSYADDNRKVGTSSWCKDQVVWPDAVYSLAPLWFTFYNFWRQPNDGSDLFFESLEYMRLLSEAEKDD